MGLYRLMGFELLWDLYRLLPLLDLVSWPAPGPDPTRCGRLVRGFGPESCAEI